MSFGHCVSRYEIALPVRLLGGTRPFARRHVPAALDGIYVLRTSVAKKVLGTEDTVRAYKDLPVRPVHHFRGLLAHLATLTKNTIQPKGGPQSFDRLALSTELQRKAIALLEIPVSK